MKCILKTLDRKTDKFTPAGRKIKQRKFVHSLDNQVLTTMYLGHQWSPGTPSNQNLSSDGKTQTIAITVR